MSEQTAPEPSPVTQGLAEKVARAWHEHVAHITWEQATGKDRMIALAEKRLEAFRAAGLAVVELPEPDRRVLCEDFNGQDTTAPQWALVGGDVLTVFTEGVESDEHGLIERLDDLRIPALKMLAAAVACEQLQADNQGGEPR